MLQPSRKDRMNENEEKKEAPPNAVSHWSGFQGSAAKGGPRAPNLRIEPRGAFRLTRNPFASNGLTSSGGFLPAIHADRAGLLPGMPGYRDFQGFRASPGFQGYGTGHAVAGWNSRLDMLAFPEREAHERSAGFQFFRAWAHSPAGAPSAPAGTVVQCDPRIGAVRATDGPSDASPLAFADRRRAREGAERREAVEAARWDEIGINWTSPLRERLAPCRAIGADGTPRAKIDRWSSFLILVGEDVYDYLSHLPLPACGATAPVQWSPAVPCLPAVACSIGTAERLPEWRPWALSTGITPRPAPREAVRARARALLLRGADVTPQYGTRHAIGSGSVDGSGAPGLNREILVPELRSGEALRISRLPDGTECVAGKAVKVHGVRCRYCTVAGCPAAIRPGSQCPRAAAAWKRYPELRAAETAARKALRAHGDIETSPAVKAARDVATAKGAAMAHAASIGAAWEAQATLETRAAEHALREAITAHEATARELRAAERRAISATRAAVSALGGVWTE